LINKCLDIHALNDFVLYGVREAAGIPDVTGKPRVDLVQKEYPQSHAVAVSVLATHRSFYPGISALLPHFSVLPI
jgi:hypothetical protein